MTKENIIHKKEQLFYSHNHPNNHLLIEFTNRIMKFLGYKCEEMTDVDFEEYYRQYIRVMSYKHINRQSTK